MKELIILNSHHTLKQTLCLQQAGQLGGLAQLARALDLHSRGHRFDSDILHKKNKTAIASG